jgi:four helix bundle protein
MPKDEVFGLTIQVRRSATAIATRIAEGCGRDVNAEYASDLRRAKVSCNELEYLIVVIRDLKYWNDELCDTLTTEVIDVRKMLHGLLRKL